MARQRGQGWMARWRGDKEGDGMEGKRGKAKEGSTPNEIPLKLPCLLRPERLDAGTALQTCYRHYTNARRYKTPQRYPAQRLELQF
ncbi:hypothetical protein E2C01_043233 [Portunus trituberculatus]|uniref:Uncharacterized protein n=1 Tax=Portunus trituberculatus TaxID=210409 RepID=A0A5B7FVS2_PORTR|nr:hypothetical protein [Portunus trituberculatus]